MKGSEYWKRRAEKRMYNYQVKADETANVISNAYMKATNQINSEIRRIFSIFSGERLPEREAIELLNNLPDKTELNNLKSIIGTIQDINVRKSLLDIVNAPAYAYRIKRFQNLQKDVETNIRLISSFEEKATTEHYISMVNEAYNRTVFDIQQGTGVGFSFSQMPKSRIKEILSNNWSGKLFSERIWGKAEDLNASIQKELLTGILSGRSIDKTAKALEERMAVGSWEARRLVRTETTYISNMAEMDSYKECEIEMFEFVATLDMRTSPTCQTMDGKRFPVSEAVSGVNIPPLHPWCRSTTIAVIDGAVTDGLKRRAKDPKTGKTNLVPADMTYKQWKKDVDKKHGDGTWATERKKVVNRKTDTAQYKRYLDVLGASNMPETFDKFQNLKYNNSDKWNDIKYYARNINGRPIEYVKIDRELEKLGVINKGKAYPIEDIEIKGWRTHALKRLESRHISEKEAVSYKDNAIIMLKKYPEPETQYNYYSDKGVIGVKCNDGLVCTAYDEKEFGKETKSILEVSKKWLSI